MDDRKTVLMNDRGTIITRDDADNAYLIKVTVAALRQYIDGADINESIPEWDSVVDQCQGDVRISNERRFIMIEVVP